MAIDTRSETLLSLAEATKVLPPINNKRPAISTLWRWCRKGLRGVKLDYVRVGRNIATSREALDRFFVSLAAVDTPLDSPSSVPPIPRSRRKIPTRRTKSIERAEHRLQKAGI
ncbi:MAG: DUF1580 domain-containing protein [Phycisphaerae bacterium]|nr:DUF1580 domain-containing protein [Phycisphaerae bacterium]